MRKKAWPCLQYLNLSSNSICNEGVRELLKLEASKLCELYIGSNCLNDGCLYYLRQLDSRQSKIISLCTSCLTEFKIALAFARY